jgi:hypothetical protein
MRWMHSTSTQNFDLNFDLEEDEAGTVHGRLKILLNQFMPHYVSYMCFYCHCVDEDADVYADDFHVIFAEEELQQSNGHDN